MITVNINTTAGQDNWLARLLTFINNQRTASGQPIFTDINAMCTDVLTTQLLSWVQQMIDQDAVTVMTAYKSSTNAVKNQVKTDLGM